MGTKDSIFDLQMELADVEDKRANLLSEKRKFEAEMQGLNNRVRSSPGRLPQAEYKAICKRQERVRSLIIETQEKLGPVNTEHRRVTAMIRALDEPVNKEKEPVVVANPARHVGRLVMLRNKYLQFAEDQTRVNSMRVMAAQFANELTAIIGEEI